MSLLLYHLYLIFSWKEETIFADPQPTWAWARIPKNSWYILWYSQREAESRQDELDWGPGYLTGMLYVIYKSNIQHSWGSVLKL
jgi:long-subunit fatty acid transport protein